MSATTKSASSSTDIFSLSLSGFRLVLILYHALEGLQVIYKIFLCEVGEAHSVISNSFSGSQPSQPQAHAISMHGSPSNKALDTPRRLIANSCDPCSLSRFFVLRLAFSLAFIPLLYHSLERISTFIAPCVKVGEYSPAPLGTGLSVPCRGRRGSLVFVSPIHLFVHVHI